MTSTINASTSSGIVQSADTSGILQLQTANTAALTIDASQNVGIGTASPSFGLVVQKDNGSGYVAGFRSTSGSPMLTIQTTGGTTQLQGLNSALSATADIAMQVSGGNVGIGTSSPAFPLDVAGAMRGNSWIGRTNTSAPTADAAIYRAADNTLAFSTANTERMRIDSSGNLLVNRTTQSQSGQYSADFDGTSKRGAVYNNTAAFTSSNFVTFSDRGTIVGTIAQNGPSTVNYATSSDYRLKENIAPMQNALATVQALKPVTYKWKSDGSDGQGFIAHELQAVVPDCVTGEKDAVEIVDDLDDEGKVISTKEVPRYQGIDTSFLVATLTAAIQEQQALIESLTTRLTALEAK